MSTLCPLLKDFQPGVEGGNSMVAGPYYFQCPFCRTATNLNSFGTPVICPKCHESTEIMYATWKDEWDPCIIHAIIITDGLDYQI